MYDDSPVNARVPLAPEEVEGLLLTDGAEISSQPRRVRHLLTRMRATMAAHVVAVRSLQRDLESLTEGRGVQDPVARALDALSSCSYDQQRQVYDQRAQALLDAVDLSRREGEQARVAAASETNRARVALAQAMEAPGLDEATRKHLAAALSQIPLMRRPAPAAPVDTVGRFVVAPKLEPHP